MLLRGLYKVEKDDKGRMIRRNMIRYITLSYCIALRYFIDAAGTESIFFILLYYDVYSTRERVRNKMKFRLETIIFIQNGEFSSEEEVSHPGAPGARRHYAS